MPARQNKQALFLRWLWLVYLPLGFLVVGLPLVFFGVLTGPLVWLVGLLAAYCAIPVRLLLETRRKGLELPMPPGMNKPAGLRMPSVPLRRPDAAGSRTEATTSAQPAKKIPPTVRRRRAVAGLLAIGVVGLLGVLLFILGMNRAGSGRIGLLLIGLGSFLMLLSVTLPTFKIVDITLRSLGRLLSSRKGGSPRSGSRPVRQSDRGGSGIPPRRRGR